jgi:hypothetical protein
MGFICGKTTATFAEQYLGEVDMHGWKPYHDPPPKEWVMTTRIWERFKASVPSMSEEERSIIDIENKTFGGIPIKVYDTDAECKAHCLTAPHPVVWLNDAD